MSRAAGEVTQRDSRTGQMVKCSRREKVWRLQAVWPQVVTEAVSQESSFSAPRCLYNTNKPARRAARSNHGEDRTNSGNLPSLPQRHTSARVLARCLGAPTQIVYYVNVETPTRRRRAVTPEGCTVKHGVDPDWHLDPGTRGSSGSQRGSRFPSPLKYSTLGPSLAPVTHLGI